MRGDDKAIRLALLATNEFSQLPPGDFLKREGCRGTKMFLAAQPDSVAALTQKMNDTSRAGLHLAVVGVGAITNWKQARVELLPGGSAHRGCREGPGKAHPFRRKQVNIGGLHLLISVAARVAPGLVIRENDDNIRRNSGLLLSPGRERSRAREHCQQEIKKASCHSIRTSDPRHAAAQPGADVPAPLQTSILPESFAPRPQRPLPPDHN